MLMEIQSSQNDNGVTTLTIQGEFDMHSCSQVQTHLGDLFKSNARGIVVDLSRVSYIDSFGIATLVEGLQWSHGNNTKFRLTCLTPAVEDVFKIANLQTVFEIFDSPADALKGL